MATSGLRHIYIEPMHSATHFEEIYSGPLPRISADEFAGSAPRPSQRYVSKESALRGARGILVALGLEAAAAAVVLGVFWMLRL